jgi:hypothetical protein
MGIVCHKKRVILDVTVTPAWTRKSSKDSLHGTLPCDSEPPDEDTPPRCHPYKESTMDRLHDELLAQKRPAQLVAEQVRSNPGSCSADMQRSPVYAFQRDPACLVRSLGICMHTAMGGVFGPGVACTGFIPKRFAGCTNSCWRKGTQRPCTCCAHAFKDRPDIRRRSTRCARNPAPGVRSS